MWKVAEEGIILPYNCEVLAVIIEVDTLNLEKTLEFSMRDKNTLSAAYVVMM